MSSKEDYIHRFIAQSPPGEVNDVFNDVRSLLNDDELLQSSVESAFEKYNKEQFVSAVLQGNNHPTIISEFNHIPEDKKYFDGKSRKMFEFDHIQLEVSNVEDYPTICENEDHRIALINASDIYANDHYVDGIVNVIDKETEFYILFVGNKYNPNNFWNGRWRSSWKVTMEGEIDGTIQVHVHYYEDGNVQMQTVKNTTCSLDAVPDTPEAFGKEILKKVSKLEEEFQSYLNEAYIRIAESTFKELRRALPVTRTKLDWNAIANYKLGAELSSKQ